MDCDYNDMCPICRQLIWDPASTTACGHTACHACLMKWIAVSKLDPQPLDASFRISSEPKLSGLSLGCPICRTETEISLDSARLSQLESRYPKLYKERAMQDTEMDPLMTIQFGNTHKRVPPSISPYSGMLRTHHWTFFLMSSHTDLIESVDLVLHESFQTHRFVTLRKPPFTKSSLGWGYFRFTAFITLRDEWEWESPVATNSASKRKGRKDRLPVDYTLDFKENGSQSLELVQVRRLHTMDETLTCLRYLFAAD